MRWTLVLLLATAALAGCADDEADSSGSLEETDGGEVALPPLPEGLNETGEVAMAALEPNVPLVAMCGAPTSDCREYTFTVDAEGNTTFNATLTLAWGSEDNDFDLWLFDAEGNEVAYNVDFPPASSAVLAETLGAGDYTVRVVPWNVIQDAFTLTVAFEHNLEPAEDAAEEGSGMRKA